MHNNISKELFVPTSSQQVAIRAGFFMLIVFALTKPLTLMGSGNLVVGGIEVSDIMGVGISYLLILPLLVGLRQLQFDRLSFFILLFSLYAVESLIWGSEIRKVAQTILPFILFFSVRSFITESNQIKVLIGLLVLGFLIPIIISTYNVALGRNIEMVENWNQLERHGGAFSGSHVLAYTMLFFSFFYCILHQVYQFKISINRYLLGLFLLLSVYCLYQSHTRTAVIGFVLFWIIYLWGNNKRSFFIAIIISAFAGIILSGHIYKFIFKKDVIDLNTATSGRVEIIISNATLFLDSSITEQLIGRGLGHEHPFAFHNDYIRLLMDLGVIGVLLYLILLFSLLWDIYLCEDKKTKYLFGGILISAAAMNFGSNAIVFRIELSQYFWLIMGLFYSMSKIRNEEYDA